MITRQHLGLALICGLIPASVIAGSDPFLIIVILSGIALGAILPDIHMKRPKKTRLLTAAGIIAQAGKKTCVTAMCLLYRVILRIRIPTDDKRLTHSVPGVILYFALLSLFAGAIVILSGNRIPASLAKALLLGLFIGLIFHLAEDLCTRKGIAIFFPFATTSVCGSIRPCNLLDNRIPGFHIQHAAILAAFLLLSSVASWPENTLLAFGLIGTSACIGIMISQSEVRIEQDTGQTSTNPEAVSA
ncbi:MAG: metal-dependent hydrolase [Methanoregula sp.]